MKQTINKSRFRDAMDAVRPATFSYEGLGLLFDYLEELEEGTGTEIELDPISFCCTYSEVDKEEIDELDENNDAYEIIASNEKLEIYIIAYY